MHYLFIYLFMHLCIIILCLIKKEVSYILYFIIKSTFIYSYISEKKKKKKKKKKDKEQLFMHILYYIYIIY